MDLNEGLPSGSTPLTPEDLEGLLPRYITTKKDLYDAEFKNISEATNKYLLSKRRRLLRFDPLSLYRLHKEMFGHVWAWAGKKRTSNKNIGVDKSQIDAEMKKLADDHAFWLEHGWDPIEISARLHHRLVKIHPFHNGNGLWARLIANIFLKESAGSFIRFPEDDLLVATEIRKRYIRVLLAADHSDYGPLIEFHKEFMGPSSPET